MAMSALTPNLPFLLTRRLFSRRDQIPPTENVLWRIERGVVRTATWSEEGTLITLGYWGGDVVRHALPRIKPYEIECLTAVEVSSLPSQLWCQAKNAIILHIQQEELLSIVHQNPIRQRLWQFLVWDGEKFGRDVEQGRLIDLRRSTTCFINEVAAMTNLSIFAFEEHSVHFVDTAQQSEWVVQGICECLELSDTSKALEPLQEKGTKIVRSPSGE